MSLDRVSFRLCRAKNNLSKPKNRFHVMNKKQHTTGLPRNLWPHRHPVTPFLIPHPRAHPSPPMQSYARQDRHPHAHLHTLHTRTSAGKSISVHSPPSRFLRHVRTPLRVENLTGRLGSALPSSHSACAAASVACPQRSTSPPGVNQRRA